MTASDERLLADTLRLILPDCWVDHDQFCGGFVVTLTPNQIAAVKRAIASAHA